jgi:hypothetical protein
MANQSNARLNAALREIGKLSALVDDLRGELTECRREVSDARSHRCEAVAPSATATSTTSSASSDRQVRALNFQLVQERNAHDAAIERIAAQLQQQREQLATCEDSQTTAVNNFRNLNTMTLRACDEAEEYISTLQVSLASLGVLTIPSIHPCVEGLQSLMKRLRSRSASNAALDATVGPMEWPDSLFNAASAMDMSTASTLPNPFVSAAAHLRTERAATATARMSNTSKSRAASASAGSSRYGQTRKGASPPSKAAASVPANSAEKNAFPLTASTSPSSPMFLKTLCGDLSKENHALRLKEKSAQELVSQLSSKLRQTQNAADAAKSMEYAVEACRDHAALLEAKIKAQETTVLEQRERVSSLYAEIQQLTLQRDDAVQRLDFALRRATLTYSIAAAAPVQTIQQGKEPSAALVARISRTERPQQQTRRESGSRPKSTAPLNTSISVASTKSAGSKRAGAPAPRAASASSSSSSRPKAAAAKSVPARRTDISPSTLSTTASDSTNTTDFMEHMTQIMNNSVLAPVSSPAVQQEVVRQVINRSVLDASLHSGHNTPATSVRMQTSEAARGTRSTAGQSDILRQLREMDAELDQLTKTSQALHSKSMRTSRAPSLSASSISSRSRDVARDQDLTLHSHSSISSDSLESSSKKRSPGLSPFAKTGRTPPVTARAKTGNAPTGAKFSDMTFDSDTSEEEEKASDVPSHEEVTRSARLISPASASPAATRSTPTQSAARKTRSAPSPYDK